MLSTEILQGTVFSWVYSLFRVSGDDELMHNMTLIALIYIVVVGCFSIFVPAPYGKHSERNQGKWNIFSILFGQTITMNATLTWIIQEAPAFIVPVALIIQTPCSKLRESDANKIALFLFTIHYFHRTAIFPFRLKNSKPVPVLSFIMAFVFTFYNGFFQAMYLTNIHIIETSVSTVLGTLIFIAGMSINVYCDSILIGLRQTTGKKVEGKSEYKIPRGGLFELISGANYFGEIVEWWGLFILTKGTPQLIFALFSNVFLGLRAFHHHKWYKKTFGRTYPEKRKAIIPYIL